MHARRRSPISAFEELRHEVTRLFENLASGPYEAWFPHARTFPSVNVWEDGQCLYVEAELPGVGKADLEVYAVGNELTIKGRRQAYSGENLSYHRQERATGAFSRVVALPGDVTPEGVEAVLSDGVLTVTLPKAELAGAKKITIRTG